MKLPSVVDCTARAAVLFLALSFTSDRGLAADKLIGFHSARTMSQAMPWIAEEAGLFKKDDLDFQLVYISSAPLVTAAILGGDAQVAISGGEAIIRAHAQGATDLVFVASAKNTLTHSGQARDQKTGRAQRQKVGCVSARQQFALFRYPGSAKKRHGTDGRDFHSDRRAVENLAALFGGSVDAATMTGPSGGVRAAAQGFR